MIHIFVDTIFGANCLGANIREILREQILYEGSPQRLRHKAAQNGQ
jgi:hypothetical protein